MIKLNIHEAKNHLSRYLDKLKNGETILLCKHNKPVAEIRGLPAPPPSRKRPIGLANGQFTIPDSFFEPLPDELLKARSGQSE
ncbi:type II toxin-antitoxin system Phd/YefM family antitoxin [Nitrospira sp. T9]|uniref:type II toxin-antitoxin system Phd/YefM family antitoxin n=1 Tax=unclassified Nitrospira TaxID=2652172 RepID=UPI003F9E8286